MTTEDPKTDIEAPRSGTPAPKPHARRWTLRRISGLVGALAALGTVLAGLTGYWTTYRTVTRELLGPAKWGPTAPAEAAHLSIVVLPFANLSGDPNQDYFADSITEDLTTGMSRIRNSFVIGRNTAFTYKGKAVDLKQIGRELGVRYVLEGSVQRGGNRLRVNVQLIDAETGNHLWAERFDKPVADLFDMQDEIVARLANQLGAQLIEAEARRARQSPLPDSMDLYFQGMAWMNKGTTPENVARARGDFEQALTLDAGNIEALVGMVWADLVSVSTYMADDSDAVFAKAEVVLTRALSLAPQHAGAHLLLGFVQFHTNRVVQGIAECERALTLDRNLAGAHGTIGLAKIYLGRVEETEGHVLEALRLSPRDHHAYTWMMFVGIAKICLGKNEEAVAWLRRALETNRNLPLAHFHLAAALAQLGRVGEARSAVAARLALNPTFTIHRFRRMARSDDQTVRAQGRRLVEGMRKAGVQFSARRAPTTKQSAPKGAVCRRYAQGRGAGRMSPHR